MYSNHTLGKERDCSKCNAPFIVRKRNLKTASLLFSLWKRTKCFLSTLCQRNLKTVTLRFLSKNAPNVFYPRCAREIWKRRRYFFFSLKTHQMFSFYALPEKFENGVATFSLWKRIKRFPSALRQRNLKTQFPVVLYLCLSFNKMLPLLIGLYVGIFIFLPKCFSFSSVKAPSFVIHRGRYLKCDVLFLRFLFPGLLPSVYSAWCRFRRRTTTKAILKRRKKMKHQSLKFYVVSYRVWCDKQRATSCIILLNIHF